MTINNRFVNCFKVVALLAIVALGASACGPDFERLEIDQLSTPPINPSMVSDHIEFTNGIGAIIKVTPVSRNSVSYDESDEVELESENIQIMRVYKGEANREFGIVGCAPGKTQMRVLINGSQEGEIRVTVK